MSIPFSNTQQRIPRGFANLLEGLAREVLREQPEDIPCFAAEYFEDLLEERERHGIDPSEWKEQLEELKLKRSELKKQRPTLEQVSNLPEISPILT
uniref:Sperm surface protein Sp17 n=1 Tax=Sphenodon punctatus TaxID=8508 RepID=A0A8D0L201_SPHPU